MILDHTNKTIQKILEQDEFEFIDLTQDGIYNLEVNRMFPLIILISLFVSHDFQINLMSIFHISVNKIFFYFFVDDSS